MLFTAGRHLYVFRVYVKGYDENHTYRELDDVEELDIEAGYDTDAAFDEARREAALLYDDFRLVLDRKI